MGTRRDPRKAHREVPIATGPLRNDHKAALKKIWDDRPCLPSLVSRKAWASSRGLDPTFVNRWFYAQRKKARTFGLELDVESEGYDLELDDGSPVGEPPLSTPLERGPILHSTTPDGLPELTCHEYPTSGETGLRIPLSPGQSSSPIFGSSFYSPKLILDSPSGAYGHPAGPEQFLFTPPSLLERMRISRPRSHSQHFVEDQRAQIHQSVPPLARSPVPNNCLPPLPLAPRKFRPSRGSHDILNFRIQDDSCLRFPLPASSPTPAPSGYLVPYHIDSQVQEEDDKPNLSTPSDLRMIVTKPSRQTDQKRGGYIDDDQSLNDRDNQTTTPFPKYLWTRCALYTIAQTIAFPISLHRPGVDGYIACISGLPIHPDPLYPQCPFSRSSLSVDL